MTFQHQYPNAFTVDMIEQLNEKENCKSMAISSNKRSANVSYLQEHPPQKRQLTTNDTYITLTFKDWSNDNISQSTYLKVTNNTQLVKVFIDYAKCRGMNVTSFGFFLNGNILNWSGTVFSCGIKDYDVIECVRLGKNH